MDKPAKALWEPLNTFAWLKVISSLCCGLGYVARLDLIHQSNKFPNILFLLSAKILLKIIFGQYFDSVTLQGMRCIVHVCATWNCKTALTTSLFFFVTFELFFTFEIVYFSNNYVCMCTSLWKLSLQQHGEPFSLPNCLLNRPFMVDANLLFLLK